NNMLVVVMLETLDGIINADEIASTFGIDVVIQGNNDLSRFSGWAQTDPRYQSLLTVSRNATLKAGKFWGNAGAQYLTGNPLSPDVRFAQNGPSIDGWTPPARGRRNSTEEPTIGLPDGRARAAAGVPSQPNTFYAGFDNGGIWRSTDFGANWVPLFDDQSTGSIGAIAVAPSNPNVIYVGTGAGIIRPDLAIGNGMYKSTDAGRTWQHLGLRDSQMIAAIAVDPGNAD